MELEEYSVFTEERYKALYDKVYKYQERLFSQMAEASRDSVEGFQYVQSMFTAYSDFKLDDDFKDAIDTFDFAYPLWHSMPELMKGVEQIRLKMHRKYLTPKLGGSENQKEKVVKRFKLFGILPWLPRTIEIFSQTGELVERRTYESDFNLTSLIAYWKAKTTSERFEARLKIYRLAHIESLKPIEIESAWIVGEPTRKRLFHSIVKFRAIRDFVNHIRNSDVSNYKEIREIYQRVETLTVPNVVAVSEGNSSIQSDIEAIELIESSRKRQALAFYYLLTAGGVKGVLGNKSGFARFMAFMSAYNFADEGVSARNIYNTSFYRITKSLFGQKSEDYNPDDLAAVVKCFEEFDSNDSSVLRKAIELIKKDTES